MLNIIMCPLVIIDYASIEELENSIGEYLKYTESENRYKQFKSNGEITASNRPPVTGMKNWPEFWAVIKMKNGRIHKIISTTLNPDLSSQNSLLD